MCAFCWWGSADYLGSSCLAKSLPVWVKSRLLVRSYAFICWLRILAHEKIRKVLAQSLSLVCPSSSATQRKLKGQMNRSNRTESLWEGDLPLRGSLRGRVFRVFCRGFQRFFRGSQRSSQRPSQRQISLSEAPSPAINLALLQEQRTQASQMWTTCTLTPLNVSRTPPGMSSHRSKLMRLIHLLCCFTHLSSLLRSHSRNLALRSWTPRTPTNSK